MIRAFANLGTKDLFYGRNTKEARKTCPRQLWTIVSRKLDQLDSVEHLAELRIPPGNRLELLAGNRKDQHSIRINERYRICFVWTDEGPDSVVVVDYHSG
jgi:proteic killer suppression protein